mgnify:FL=1
MRYRSNTFYCKLILVLTVLVAVIFYVGVGIVKLQAKKMIQDAQIEAIRTREKYEQNITTSEESQAYLTSLVYAEANPTVLQEDPGVKEAVVELVLEHYRECYETVDEHDVELLACVIYQEAGGDSCCDMCRRRVADVVLNRVKDPRFKGTTIEEILIDGDPAPQWGLYSVTGVVWPDKASLPEEQHAVERAYRIAREVLEGQHSDLTSDYIWCAEFSQGTDVIECDGIYFGK